MYHGAFFERLTGENSDSLKTPPKKFDRVLMLLCCVPEDSRNVVILSVFNEANLCSR